MIDSTTEPSAMETVSPDDFPPALSRIEPYPGVSFFQADQPIRLFFNKAVVAGSGEIILSNGSETRTIAITDTDQISFDEDIVTINPATDLIVDTTYSIQIASGVIVDAEGNAYGGLNRDSLAVSVANQDLEADTVYNLQIASGVIVDADGDPYGGTSEADMFEFTTVELGTVVDPFSPLL